MSTTAMTAEPPVRQSVRLYEISHEIRRLLDEATDEETGELTTDAEAALSALSLAFDAKVDAICCVIREQSTLADGLKAEIVRLQKLAAVRSATVDRLKGYVKHEMELLGMPKLETERFKVRIQKNPPSATATMPAEMLPAEFQRVTVTANNSAAIAIWKHTGEAPQGFEINQGTHLRIA